MNKIVDIMLGSIRAQVCGSKYTIESRLSDEELKALYSLSKSQDMAHIVAAELGLQGLLGDDEISKKFKKQQMIAVLRYERINYELLEICRVLENAEIRHMPLKGSVLRTYYPEPWMRTSADIDILIPDEEHESAKMLIAEQLGYEIGERHEHDVSLFAPSGVHLELHFGTIEEYCAVNAKSIMDNVWQSARPREGYQYQYVLTNELFYFYHIAHMAKHFEYGGCGARFYLDLWLLNKNMEFNTSEKERLLKQSGLQKFAAVSEKLANVWFSDAEHDELTVLMQGHVIGNGIYGSKENNVAWQQINNGGQLGRAKNLIFLPYEQMLVRYPQLENRKILLPLYHVRRWGSIVARKRTKRSIDMLRQNSEIAKQKTGDIRDMLKVLELI